MRSTSGRHITLPFIKDLSEQIRRIFKQHDVNLHLKAPSTIKTSLTHLKDNIHVE